MQNFVKKIEYVNSVTSEPLFYKIKQFSTLIKSGSLINCERFKVSFFICFSFLN